jgi:coenzyme PQQ precursor peptide PqqA
MLSIRKYDWKLLWRERIVKLWSRAAEFRVRKTRSAAPAMLGTNSRKGDLQMREWHKPTIEETESGMEVTSYLPAELDRA